MASLNKEHKHINFSSCVTVTDNYHSVIFAVCNLSSLRISPLRKLKSCR